MDCLTNKQTKDYNYTSRYNSFYLYYNNNDEKYIYGITGWLSEDTEYVLHEVSIEDTLDKLALKYYGRPDLFWVIADFNRITDSYIQLSDYYSSIKVPSIAGIKFKK